MPTSSPEAERLATCAFGLPGGRANVGKLRVRGHVERGAQQRQRRVDVEAVRDAVRDARRDDVRLDVQVGNDAYGKKVREASVGERHPARDGEDDPLAVHPRAIEQAVEVVAVDRGQIHVRVRHGEVQLSLADRLRALPDDRPGHARLSLERVERRVVDIDNARAGGCDRVRRRHRRRERGRDGCELQAFELRLLQEVGETRPRGRTAGPKDHEAGQPDGAATSPHAGRHPHSSETG
jgi:hypothetical protein